jgi:hypothetical protein
MKLMQHAEAVASEMRRGSDPTKGQLAEVEVTVQIGGTVVALSEDAASRIAGVLRREAQRIAEIAAVDARDQAAAPAEAKRVRAADPNRSRIIVAAGTKDPEAVIVERGSVEVAGRMRTAPKAGR